MSPGARQAVLCLLGCVVTRNVFPVLVGSVLSWRAAGSQSACGHRAYPPWAQPHQLLPQRQVPHPTSELSPAKPLSLLEPVAGRVLQAASVSKAGQQIPPALGFVLLWGDKGAFVIPAWSSVLLPHPSGWFYAGSGAPISPQRPVSLPEACLLQPEQARLALPGSTALGLSSWKTLFVVRLRVSVSIPVLPTD